MSLNQDLSRCSTPLYQGNLLPCTVGIQLTAMYSGDSKNGKLEHYFLMGSLDRVLYAMK